MGVPQWLLWEILLKIDDLGYPYFRKPPFEDEASLSLSHQPVFLFLSLVDRRFLPMCTGLLSLMRRQVLVLYMILGLIAAPEQHLCSMFETS